MRFKDSHCGAYPARRTRNRNAFDGSGQAENRQMPRVRRQRDCYVLLPEEDEERYTIDELYSLWRRFRHAHDAVTVMEGLSLMNRTQAANLIMQFERRDRGEYEPVPVLTQAVHNESDFMW